MTQGNIGAWKKQPGDSITAGDVIVEIETDKAQMDFESQDEGFFAKVLIDAGTKDVPVNTPIFVMVENKEDASAFADFTVQGSDAGAASDAKDTVPPSAPAGQAAPSSPSEPAKAENVAAAPAASSAPAPAHGDGDRVFASPAARFIAASKGVPLEQIQGTGPHGRILKSDVESFKGAPAGASAAGKQQAAPAGSLSVPAYTPAPETAQAFTDLPVSGVRKVIASRLTESKQSIPHYYLTVELEADEVIKLRETLNAKANGAFKLSLNDFVIKASALALRDVPAVNSAWQGSFIREYKTSDIAVAVATENGLITPIVPRAEAKGLSVISTTVRDLALKARDNKLQPHEYQGGSFTISNLGMYGVKSFTAIINPPHAAILAVGGVESKAVVESDAATGAEVVKAKKVMHVTLSCDHRVVDGAVGARWLQKFRGYMESPLSMLL
ncbi:hypothetical protein HK101_010538 [Irineochytrium annulatum]|nr:hypothetical protein HK101_010538 [Irineochytrium annulatum]